MYLNKKTTDIVQKLSLDKRFKEIKVIMAYPDVNKPTRLKKIVVSVSPSAIDAENISVGEECMYGEYKIDIDVFVPQNFGTPCVQEVVQNIIDALKDEMMSGIKVSEIKAYNSLFCYGVNCRLTFLGEIDFGGSADD